MMIYPFMFLIIFIKITKIYLNLSIFVLRVQTLGFKNSKLIFYSYDIHAYSIIFPTFTKLYLPGGSVLGY